MQLASTVFVVLVGIAHLGFFVLESFLWTTPFGLKTFKLTAEAAQSTASLAKNQGVYNGFLAAGLLWSLLPHEPLMTFELKVFFLGCIIVAGVVGTVTASRSILFVQALPAVLALALVWLSRAQG